MLGAIVWQINCAHMLLKILQKPKIKKIMERELFELMNSILRQEPDFFCGEFSLHFDDDNGNDEIKCYHSGGHLFSVEIQIDETEGNTEDEYVYIFSSDFDGFDEIELNDALNKIKKNHGKK